MSLPCSIAIFNDIHGQIKPIDILIMCSAHKRITVAFPKSNINFSDGYSVEYPLFSGILRMMSSYELLVSTRGLFYNYSMLAPYSIVFTAHSSLQKRAMHTKIFTVWGTTP